MRSGLLLGLFLCGILSVVRDGRAEDHPVSVSVEDIQRGKVAIVGRLGVPIGTVVEITGEWIKGEPPPKREGELTFLVWAIGGRRLKTPLEYLESDLTIIRTIPRIVGQPVNVVAFESILWSGIPDSAWAEGQRQPGRSRSIGIHSLLNLVRPADRAERASTRHNAGNTKSGGRELPADQQLVSEVQSIAVGMELQQALTVLKRNMVDVKQEGLGAVTISEEDGWVQYVAKPGYESEDALVLLAKDDRRTGSHKIESIYWHIKYDEDYNLPKAYRALRYLHLQSIDASAFLPNEHSSKAGRPSDDNPFE